MDATHRVRVSLIVIVAVDIAVVVVGVPGVVGIVRGARPVVRVVVKASWLSKSPTS